MKKITYVEVNCNHEKMSHRRFDYANLWVFRTGEDLKDQVREYSLSNNRRFDRAVNLLQAFAASHPLDGE